MSGSVRPGMASEGASALRRKPPRSWKACDSLSRLTAQGQKAVKTTAFDPQLDASAPFSDDRIIGTLKEHARRRSGYPRLHIPLKREGVALNNKTLFRLCRGKRLTVRRRCGVGAAARALGTRAPMAIPQGPNQRRSLDFVSDVLADGRRIRALVVVDDFTRECLARVVDTSLSGSRVARELDRQAELRGLSLMIVSDNGAGLTP
jgi:putative transposase